MYDTSKVVVGIALFLGAVSSPLWYNSISGGSTKVPDLDLGLPVVRPGEQGFEWLPRDIALTPDGKPKECIEPLEIIRKDHMRILDVFRDEVVREGKTDYHATTGKVWPHMKLTGTCLSCHTKKADFCDRCHTYAGEEPYCFDCHLDRVAKRGE